MIVKSSCYIYHLLDLPFEQIITAEKTVSTTTIEIKFRLLVNEIRIYTTYMHKTIYVYKL